MSLQSAPMSDTTHPQIKAFEKRLSELGISRPEMYKLMGIYKEKYGNWRTRGIPKGQTFKAAKIAKCDPEALENGIIEPIYNPARSETQLKETLKSQKNARLDTDFKHNSKVMSESNIQEAPPLKYGQYPLISWVQAGEFEEAFDTFEVGDAEKWMPAPPMYCSDKTYVLRVRGDSMTSPYGKSYPDGSLIYVDPEKQPNTGDLVIAKVNGDNGVNFKQFVHDGGNIFLKSLNPSYPPITKEFRIIGTVIFAGFEP